MSMYVKYCPEFKKKIQKNLTHFPLNRVRKKLFMRHGFSRVAICPSRTKHVYVIARYGL